MARMGNQSELRELGYRGSAGKDPGIQPRSENGRKPRAAASGLGSTGGGPVATKPLMPQPIARKPVGPKPGAGGAGGGRTIQPVAPRTDSVKSGQKKVTSMGRRVRVPIVKR